MKDTIKLAIILLTIIFVVLITANTHSTDSAEKKAFMDNCVVNKSLKNFCECTYNKIRQNFTDEEIIAFGDYEYRNGMPPPEVIQVTKSCMGEL